METPTFSQRLPEHLSSLKKYDFGMAIQLMRGGHRLARLNWNGKGQWLELQRPDEHSKMTLPYIFITTVSGDRVPWLASQTDMLSEDWIIV